MRLFFTWKKMRSEFLGAGYGVSEFALSSVM
jgi:hypothetical protein